MKFAFPLSEAFVTPCSRRIAHLGLAAAGLLMTLSIFTLFLAPRLSKPIAAADMGTVAPDFVLRDTDGRATTLSRLRGQTVVLFFSSLHCPVSGEYNARVTSLARHYSQDSRVRFLAINVDSPSERADPLQVRVDAKIVGRTFTTLLDDRARVAERYSATHVPEFVVIDASGIVRYRGPFDNNPNPTLASQSFCADVLHEILSGPTYTVAAAGSIRR